MIVMLEKLPPDPGGGGTSIILVTGMCRCTGCLFQQFCSQTGGRFLPFCSQTGCNFLPFFSQAGLQWHVCSQTGLYKIVLFIFFVNFVIFAPYLVFSPCAGPANLKCLKAASNIWIRAKGMLKVKARFVTIRIVESINKQFFWTSNQGNACRVEYTARVTGILCLFS